MDFLGFGGWEIFLIIIVALIIYGPTRMIEISRSLGKMVNNFKKISTEFTSQITREIDEQKKLNELKKNDTATRPEDIKP